MENSDSGNAANDHSLANEKGVSNPKGPVTDFVNKHYLDDHPAANAYANEVYHKGVAVLKDISANNEGAQNERNRAAEFHEVGKYLAKK